MDQKKIGSLLKELRKEKGLTQEQLAEHFLVSTRSVSRWENGINMPELSLLVEIAYFHCFFSCFSGACAFNITENTFLPSS